MFNLALALNEAPALLFLSFSFSFFLANITKCSTTPSASKRTALFMYVLRRDVLVVKLGWRMEMHNGNAEIGERERCLLWQDGGKDRLPREHPRHSAPLEAALTALHPHRGGCPGILPTTLRVVHH